MKKFDVYNEEALYDLLCLQKKHEWNIEEDINWTTKIDLNKPLVALDENALFFPGASSEQRLAISYLMGLAMASSICEMEECLIKFKKISWEDIIEKYPVSPEFNELGEQFFIEENKHSQSFKRYLIHFADEVGIELKELNTILPIVEDTTTEWLYQKNLESGGYAFWWTVAEVEQQFLHLHSLLAPYKTKIEPLYYNLHRLHFEEEARHAPFPYLMLNLLIDRQNYLSRLFNTKKDLIFAQSVLTFWTGASVLKSKKVKLLASKHPLFKTLSSVIPLFEKQPFYKTTWNFLTQIPYISSLINPNYHKKFISFKTEKNAWGLPFPAPIKKNLVNY